MKHLSIIGLVIMISISSIGVSCFNYGKNIDKKPTADLRDSIHAKFPIQRGINISHWLSQNPDQSILRSKLFTENDIIFLSGIGYDHIRIPFDEENLWDINGVKYLESFQLLHNAIGWCIKHNLRVIMDLHSCRSHSFNRKKNLIWESSIEKEKFVKLWLEISAEFKRYPNNIVAYELLNEAVADNASNWNDLVALTLCELRKAEPIRMIIIGSNMWQSPNTFHDLVLPETDKNIIVSFHFYTPHILTHYKASWMAISKYYGSVNYPGQIVDLKELSTYGEDVVEEVSKYNGYFTIDTLLNLIKEPILFAKKHGLQLYCGEFGCLPTVHRSARLQWYRDMRYILETNNISWANWDYKGAFGIFNQQTGRPDNELIKVLLGKISK